MAITQFTNELITKTKLNALVDGINTNTGDMTALDGRVGSLDGRVGSLDGRVGSLDGRVGSLELSDSRLSISDTLITFKTTGGATIQEIRQSSDNTALGVMSLYNNTLGYFNVALGNYSLFANTLGLNNTALGVMSLYNNTTGSNNTALGRRSLYNNTTGSNNTALGHGSLDENTEYSNCSGIGQKSQVSASNQVQLGNSSTTTYVYGTVQNRSDKRDKTDITPTQLGLDFILKLTPVDYKWDMREDYIEYEETEEGRKIKVDIDDVVRDGSKKRNRNHSGFIAQEVKEVIDDLGVDFGGYQDHSINGGKDVLSLGYDEFIAPMVKAIQELTTMVKDLQAEVESLKSPPTE